MDLGLRGKVALVTASSGGIGLETARSLAREGARVIVNGRTDASVSRAMATIRKSQPDSDLVPLAADNSSAAGCAMTIEAYPSVDILVNNLGIYEAVGFFEESDDAWFRFFELNVMSGVRLSRHYLKDMLARGAGRIIFISSEAALSPAPEMAHYCATKTMQLSISRSLAESTKGTAVTVNTVMPGPTMTDGVRKLLEDVFPGLAPAEAEARFIEDHHSTSLIQRFIRSEEIGDAVTFVASDKASAINGAVLRVEGGGVKFVV